MNSSQIKNHIYNRSQILAYDQKFQILREDIINYEEGSVKKAIEAVDKFGRKFTENCAGYCENYTKCLQPIFSKSLEQLVVAIQQENCEYQIPSAVKLTIELSHYSQAVKALKNYSSFKEPFKNHKTFPLRAAAVWGDLLRKNVPIQHIILTGPGVYATGYPLQLAELMQIVSADTQITILEKDARILDQCKQFNYDFNDQLALDLTVFLKNNEYCSEAEFPYRKLRQSVLTPLKEKAKIKCIKMDLYQDQENLTDIPKATAILATFVFTYVIRDIKKYIRYQLSINPINEIAKKNIFFDKFLPLMSKFYTNYINKLSDEGTLYVDYRAISSIFQIAMDGPSLKNEKYFKKFKKLINKNLEPTNRYIKVQELVNPFQHIDASKNDQLERYYFFDLKGDIIQSQITNYYAITVHSKI